MSYEVRTSGGDVVGFETYGAAIAWCESEWPEAEIGHDGDATSGGERTLVWACEEDSEDDAGESAVASIWPIVEDYDLYALRDEAEAHGDEAQARLCERAVDGDGCALAECAWAIDEARAAAASYSDEEAA